MGIELYGIWVSEMIGRAEVRYSYDAFLDEGLIWEKDDILEGEFSALFDTGKSAQEIYESWSMCGNHTAKTLNREVFPAFWRPIIVISISVALSSTNTISIECPEWQVGTEVKRSCLQAVIAQRRSPIDTADGVLTRIISIANHTPA